MNDTLTILVAAVVSLVFIVWMAYALGVIYLAFKGWRKTTYRVNSLWPMRVVKWEKIGKTGRVLTDEDTFLRAWAAERKLQRLWRRK